MSNFQVAVQYHNFEYQIRVPSYLFEGKLEGLCGNADDDSNNDYKKPNNEYTTNIEEFGISWMSDEYSQNCTYTPPCTGNNCAEIPPTTEPPCVELPTDTNPCDTILNEHIFGKCHILLDPTPYLESCAEDLCEQGLDKETICNAIEKYARDCLRAGVCIEWKQESSCVEKCPDGMEYKSCGVGCIETCDNYEDLRKLDAPPCPLEKLSGCFCTDGKVN